MKELKALYAIISQMELDKEIPSPSAKILLNKINTMLRDKQTDKVELWWNNLSETTKRTYVDQTLSLGLFDDDDTTNITYKDIEMIYDKFK